MVATRPKLTGYGVWLGDVQYLNQADAATQKLAYVNEAGRAIIKVDSTTNVPFNDKRNSIRITSQNSYSIGSLWVIDVVHLPYGCSVRDRPKLTAFTNSKTVRRYGQAFGQLVPSGRMTVRSILWKRSSKVIGQLGLTRANVRLCQSHGPQSNGAPLHSRMHKSY